MKNKLKNTIRNITLRGKTKSSKGITLIALIITIIVLLILAGVSIGMLTGENGILTRANSSKTYNKEGRIKEEITTMLYEWNIDKNTTGITLEEFLNNKKASGEIDDVTKNDDGTFIIEKEDYEVTVNANGEITDIQEMTGAKPEGTVEVTVTDGTETKTVEIGEDGTYSSVKLDEGANTKVTIKVTGSTTEGTIEGIYKPGETEITTGESVTYEVKENGTYIFKIKGSNRRKTTVSVKINCIREIWTSLFNVTSDGAWDNTNKVNSPKLASGMTAIEKTSDYEDGKTWYEYVAADTTKALTTEGDTKLSRWANAKTEDGSYFVWIPRFAYKITAKAEGATAGIIDVVFLKDKTDKYIDENGVEQTAVRVTAGGDPTTQYVVHPAFTKTEVDGTKTYENGEWDEKLAGIWIGKFEASRVGATLTTGGTEAVTTGENITQEKVKVVPNVTSWRSIKIIGDMFDRAKEFNPNLNSHMLKNSEWGAVAYLTHSKYGRNGNEISINSYSGFVTGISGSSVSDTYETATGQTASTMGNIYGIYDMSGGAFEYVASYYNGSTSTYLTNNIGNMGAKGASSTKWATAYTGTVASTLYKKGDATYETSGWNGDFAYFVNSGTPFFWRSGYRVNSTYAGSFVFNSHNGLANGGVSFRVCLAVNE